MRYIGKLHTCDLPQGRADREAWLEEQVWQCYDCTQKWRVVNRSYQWDCAHLFHWPFKKKRPWCVRRQFFWEKYDGPVDVP